MKKRSNPKKHEYPFKDSSYITIKKDKFPYESDGNLISFVKNQEILIVEEEMISEGSDSV